MQIKRTIFFDPVEHRYTDENVSPYTSCTQVIGTYEDKFDTVPEAIKYAKRHGNTAEYWIERWAETNRIACDNGNEKHDFLEDRANRIAGETGLISDDIQREAERINVWNLKSIVKNKTIDYGELLKSDLQHKFPIIYNAILELIADGWTIHAEYITYWAEYFISGKIDLLAIKGNKFRILDWKTNKDEIKFRAGYYKKVNQVKTNEWIGQPYKRMKKCLSHLEQCKGNTYSLQLSLYARMMEEFDMICDGLIIYHIRPYGVVPIPVTYLRADVENMVKEFRGLPIAITDNIMDMFKIN